MDTKKAIVIVLGMLAGSLAGFLAPQEAHCTWCGPMQCFNHYSCTPGCVCLKQGGQTIGVCASFE